MSRADELPRQRLIAADVSLSNKLDGLIGPRDFVAAQEVA